MINKIGGTEKTPSVEQEGAMPEVSASEQSRFRTIAAGSDDVAAVRSKPPMDASLSHTQTGAPDETDTGHTSPSHDTEKNDPISELQEMIDEMSKDGLTLEEFKEIFSKISSAISSLMGGDMEQDGSSLFGDASSSASPSPAAPTPALAPSAPAMPSNVGAAASTPTGGAAPTPAMGAPTGNGAAPTGTQTGQAIPSSKIPGLQVFSGTGTPQQAQSLLSTVENMYATDKDFAAGVDNTISKYGGLNFTVSHLSGNTVGYATVGGNDIQIDPRALNNRNIIAHELGHNLGLHHGSELDAAIKSMTDGF